MYSANYIVAEPGHKANVWDCYLHGEKIGDINIPESRMGNAAKKTYRAYLRHRDKRFDMVGEYDTLFEAKRGLLQEAEKYLAEEDAKRRSEPSVAYLPEVDREFYPTPAYLAGKLLSMVNWKGVKSVLEPSAGRGDLIEYAGRCKVMSYRGYAQRVEIKDIDCIELDSNLQALLVGKGFRVIHDDFLTFNTRKRYDLILMNPPFSEGAEHLLHALELSENGGQIACILNAETIRNPYTVQRKLLMKELKKRNASILYVRDAFGRADRRANVDVALIHVNIPCVDVDNSIWDELEKAREAKIEDAAINEIAPAGQIERMLREYDMMCEAGISLMRKYNGIAPHITSSRAYSSPLITLKIGEISVSNDGCTSEDVNRFLRSVRAMYWSELFDLPELNRRMTSAMRAEYSNTISEMREYEFSEFNIRQVLARIDGQLTQGVEAAILKCFEKLSAEHTYNQSIQNDNVHYYNGWKTNKSHYVNMRCVIPTYGCFARGYTWDKYGRYKETKGDLDVHGCFQVLDDLEKALNYLDKGETTETSLEGELRAAAAIGRTSNIPCKYFDVTFYKKGTCHIRFRDQRIVDRLNIYVGRQKAWLPPTYGSVRYEDMDDESRRVVDEFQGREKYEQITKCPSDYIIETRSVPLMLS